MDKFTPALIFVLTLRRIQRIIRLVIGADNPAHFSLPSYRKEEVVSMCNSGKPSAVALPPAA